MPRTTDDENGKPAGSGLFSLLLGITLILLVLICWLLGVNSRVRFFDHEAKRKTRIFCVSCRSVMNFVRESVFAGARRKSGSVWRRAFATTSSDGGIPGRMVRS